MKPPLQFGHSVPENNNTHIITTDDLSFAIWQNLWIYSLKISHSFQFSDRDEWDDFPVEAEHTGCIWWVGEHAVWWEKGGVIIIISLLWFEAILCKLWLYTVVLYLVWNFQWVSLKSTGWPSHPTWCQNFYQRETVPLPGAKTHKLSINMLPDFKLVSCILPE